MSSTSSIQWCHSTINPAMGCDGCELFPNRSKLSRAIQEELRQSGLTQTVRSSLRIESLLESSTASEVYHSRKTIALRVLKAVNPSGKITKKAQESLARAIAKEFVCYAAILHMRHGKNPNEPKKHMNRGYAPYFEQVTKFPGRMSEAAGWKDLRGIDDPHKPWLDGCGRLIFVSDMGDLLSQEIDFEYIRDEVIANVASEKGRRHFWLWLTKRPTRMAKFSRWLEDQRIAWPDNLVAMTSVTSQRTVGRVGALSKVRCRHRGLSVEPLWSKVTLPLANIHWVIVGGESGGGAKPFDLGWARDLREQCRAVNVPFFVKQLGSMPMKDGTRLKLKDRHGGDWSDWPTDLRIREVPRAFRA